MRASAPVVLLQLFTLWGALLLFAMEPLVGRLLLPGYGGSFQVWTTCLMSFQALLLAGYAYTRWIGPRLGRWHFALLLLPVAFLPLGVGGEPDLSNPILAVLRSLGVHVAVPFTVLATTGVMAQTWLARSALRERSDPYFLYAASNAGSLLGLLGYPFLVEPLLGIRAQALVWAVGYAAYLALAVAMAARLRGAVATRTVEPAPVELAPGAAPGPRERLAWLLLSATPAILLMAVTNAIALQVGSVPLFWVLPLALYLSSFVLAFGRGGWRPSRVAAVSLAALAAALLRPAWIDLAAYLFAIFWVSLLCHAELHRRRPEPARLASFYWIQSLGGFAGGAFVAIAAPLLFPALWELAIGAALAAGVLFATSGRRAIARLGELAALRALVAREHPLRRLAALCATAAAAGLVFTASTLTVVQRSRVEGIFAHRNFYGIYSIREAPAAELGIPTRGDMRDPVRALIHGRTLHGFQILTPDGPRIPTGYYHANAPVGDVFRVLPSPKTVAVIGLGAGAMAAHFGEGDRLTYFEIDPDNERIAREHFGFLDSCPAELRVVVGDARLTLARDAGSPDGHYDALLVDAFSGDGVPAHLLTYEAIEGYLAKLAPQGLLAFHISNRYYDLRPILRSASRALGLRGRLRDSRDDETHRYESPSVLYVVARDEAVLEPLAEWGWLDPEDLDLPELRLWTDDFASLLVPLVARGDMSSRVAGS